MVAEGLAEQSVIVAVKCVTAVALNQICVVWHPLPVEWKVCEAPVVEVRSKWRLVRIEA